MRRGWSLWLAGSLLVLSGCTGQAQEGDQAPTGSIPSTVSPSTGTPSSPSPSGPVATLASGEPLPAACAAGAPTAADTVAFAAQGAAWALSAAGGDLTCLFGVDAPGPFTWGPLGDRVLLANLEVEGLPDALTHPASAIEPGPSSWGHPTGKSVVYVAPDGVSVLKLHLDTGTTEDVTPLKKAQYLNAVYHPSGTALAFVVVRGGKQSIWLSSNTGTNPVRLVFSEEGTTFGALAFSQDGQSLYYAAQHNDDHPELHVLDLVSGNAPVAWKGKIGQHVLDVSPGAATAVAFTVGTTCQDGVAMYKTSFAAPARLALPSVPGPTRVLGWLDDGTLLAATGACDQPLDLSAVDAGTSRVVPLVSSVTAGGTRALAPTPPPALPQGIGGGGGFA